LYAFAIEFPPLKPALLPFQPTGYQMRSAFGNYPHKFESFLPKGKTILRSAENDRIHAETFPGNTESGLDNEEFFLGSGEYNLRDPENSRLR
jgi:hypothetical protein